MIDIPSTPSRITPDATYLAAIAAITAQITAEITADIDNARIPSDVGCFADLHTYTDANIYADDLVTDLERTHAWVEFIVDVQDRVDVWLRAGRPDDITRQQTGSSWHESTPIYLGEHHETVPPAMAAARAARAATFRRSPTAYTFGAGADQPGH
ncbi:hypothetical protein [Nocardia camponoti]|uniref:Uncharacterized protein n=1 Tax=Nocardia camponoti TaxID=1616106 RepID=A0A917QUI6_9NOCA|nr:hypothetical protein [Nocardia camponoti]GGK69067.1 hypothetical protein GCM10011591_46500 [Nocardia camponoti]